MPTQIQVRCGHSSYEAFRVYRMHLQPAREGDEKVVKEATVALVAHVKVSALYVSYVLYTFL